MIDICRFRNSTHGLQLRNNAVNLFECYTLQLTYKWVINKGKKQLVWCWVTTSCKNSLSTTLAFVLQVSETLQKGLHTVLPQDIPTFGVIMMGVESTVKHVDPKSPIGVQWVEIWRLRWAIVFDSHHFHTQNHFVSLHALDGICTHFSPLIHSDFFFLHLSPACTRAVTVSCSRLFQQFTQILLKENLCT